MLVFNELIVPSPRHLIDKLTLVRSSLLLKIFLFFPVLNVYNSLFNTESCNKAVIRLLNRSKTYSYFLLNTLNIKIFQILGLFLVVGFVGLLQKQKKEKSEVYGNSAAH